MCAAGGPPSDASDDGLSTTSTTEMEQRLALTIALCYDTVDDLTRDVRELHARCASLEAQLVRAWSGAAVALAVALAIGAAAVLRQAPGA